MEELVRLSPEPLFVADLVRLRKTGDSLEKDEAKFQKKIEDLHREIAQLEQRRLLSIEKAAREKARLEQEAAIQSSFRGKILRIDRQAEGEKIRLSVLYQQGTE